MARSDWGHLPDDYPDVYTAEAGRRAGGAGADRRRAEGRHGGRLARAGRARDKQPITRSQSRIPARRCPFRKLRRPLRRQRIGRLERQWIQALARCRPDAGKPASVTSLRPARAPMAGCSTARRVGRVSTMSLDNQRNLARDHRVDLPVGGRDGRRGMNDWGQGFLKRPIVKDWQARLDFTTKSSARAACISTIARAPRRWLRLLGLIVDTTLFIVTNQQRWKPARRWSCICRDSDR